MVQILMNIKILATFIWNGDNMNHIIKAITLIGLLLFMNSCDDVVNEHSPQVTAEIVSIGSDTVTIKWNNVGDEYYYAVWVTQDSIQDNSFVNSISVCDNTKSTNFTIRNLTPATYYKVKVRTNGGNKAPNESFPPLLFRTMQ